VIQELLKSTASLAAILVPGSLVYFSIIRKDDHRWLEALCYGWGAGVVLLYVLGGLLIRIPQLFFSWHLYYVAFLVFPAGVLLFLQGRKQGLPRIRFGHRFASSPRIDPWAAFMVAFLSFHVLLLLWVNLNRPVFDSDAISPQRWVGLAKTIYRLGGLPASTRAWNPTFPPLIPLWPNMFTARWYDSLAAIPWFVFYVLILATTAEFVYRVAGNLRAALAYACVLATIPLMWTHVIRPGFSDLIVCYFMACVLSLLYYSHQYQQKRYFLFSLIFMAGACMSKQEAVGWMLLTYAGYGLLYWQRRHEKPVAWILGMEGIVIATGLAAHMLLAGYFYELVAGRFTYLRLLFRVRYDPAAVRLLIERTFTWATFGIYWYLVFFILIYLLVKPGSGFVRLLAAQCALAFGLILYFLCGTGNVRLTIAGTNASRLLMQWVPLGSVLYAVFISLVLRWEPGAGRAQTGSRPD
jgi:hypothetical protein